MAGSVADAAAAVERSTARFTALLRSGLDGARLIKGSAWTIRDVGAHLASGTVAYRQIVGGDGSPYVDLDARAETNQARLDADPRQDLDALADVIDAGVNDILAALAPQPASAVITWHGGISLPIRAVLGAVVGELQFHGLDVARTAGVEWRIDRLDALPVVDFFDAVAPHVVDRDAVRGIAATVEVRYRGYHTSTFDFRDGALAVAPGRATRPDVYMSVDPVAFLHVGYKRSGLTRPILTGRALAWGRRPWFALRFPGLFQAP